MMTIMRTIPMTALAVVLSGPLFAQDTAALDTMMSAGLILPAMDAEKGRTLFASKGCVVCHSVREIGGTDAPPMDAEYMDSPMNPFEFAARMWRGAETMVAMQRDELGGVIDLSGEDLAAIIAFVHDGDEQMKFSDDDIPAEIKAIMNKME
jgi:cytochrome c551/c552